MSIPKYPAFLHIHITEKDVREGKKNVPAAHPIALAIRRKYPHEDVRSFATSTHVGRQLYFHSARLQILFDAFASDSMSIVNPAKSYILMKHGITLSSYWKALEENIQWLSAEERKAATNYF